LVTNGLCILGVPIGFQGFVTHFLDEVLSQDVVHINDLFFLGNTKVALGFCLHVWLVDLLISLG
jgi:hypothetical protein